MSSPVSAYPHRAQEVAGGDPSGGREFISPEPSEQLRRSCEAGWEESEHLPPQPHPSGFQFSAAGPEMRLQVL